MKSKIKNQINPNQEPKAFGSQKEVANYFIDLMFKATKNKK